MTIFNLVPSITVTFGISALPSVTTAWTRRNRRETQRNIESVLRITALVALPAGLAAYRFVQADIKPAVWGAPAGSARRGPAAPDNGDCSDFCGSCFPGLQRSSGYWVCGSPGKIHAYRRRHKTRGEFFPGCHPTSEYSGRPDRDNRMLCVYCPGKPPQFKTPDKDLLPSGERFPQTAVVRGDVRSLCMGRPRPARKGYWGKARDGFGSSSGRGDLPACPARYENFEKR